MRHPPCDLGGASQQLHETLGACTGSPALSRRRRRSQGGAESRRDAPRPARPWNHRGRAPQRVSSPSRPTHPSFSIEPPRPRPRLRRCSRRAPIWHHAAPPTHRAPRCADARRARGRGKGIRGEELLLSHPRAARRSDPDRSDVLLRAGPRLRAFSPASRIFAPSSGRLLGLRREPPAAQSARVLRPDSPGEGKTQDPEGGKGACCARAGTLG